MTDTLDVSKEEKTTPVKTPVLESAKCWICLESKLDLQHIQCPAQHSFCYSCLDQYGRQQYHWEDQLMQRQERCSLSKLKNQVLFQCPLCRMGKYEWLNNSLFSGTPLIETYPVSFDASKYLQQYHAMKQDESSDLPNEYMVLDTQEIIQGISQEIIQGISQDTLEAPGTPVNSQANIPKPTNLPTPPKPKSLKRKRDKIMQFAPENLAIAGRTKWQDQIRSNVRKFKPADFKGVIGLCRYNPCQVVRTLPELLAHQWKCPFRSYPCPYDHHQCSQHIIAFYGQTLEQRYMDHITQGECDASFTCNLNTCSDVDDEPSHRVKSMSAQEWIEHRKNVNRVHYLSSESGNQLESLWLAVRHHNSWSTRRMQDWSQFFNELRKLNHTFERMHRLQHPETHRHPQLYELFMQIQQIQTTLQRNSNPNSNSNSNSNSVSSRSLANDSDDDE